MYTCFVKLIVTQNEGEMYITKELQQYVAVGSLWLNLSFFLMCNVYPLSLSKAIIIELISYTNANRK